ncbi:MAG: hypothetical protein MJ241_06795 [Bacilli bacterium]|nr:hypothetical protein [Bacilli bacterium]
MSLLSDLYEQLQSIPGGYISIKVINGKKRYYLQRKINGKVVSVYIKDSELEDIKEAISRRKEMEREVDRIKNEILHPLNPLSESALSLTGDLMSSDTVVAKYQNGELRYIDEDKCPLLIKRTHNLKDWLEGRSIDGHRTHSRILRKALRLKESDELRTVLRVFACTISDNFWFRPLKSKLHYDDVVFKSDLFADTALNGYINERFKPSSSPELTNTGSFEKCWKIIDNHWWMIKRGSKEELFSEWFASSLAKALGIPTVSYSIKDGNIYSMNLAEHYNLEPISSLAGDDDSYENVFPVIYELGEEFAKDYLMLMWFDVLVSNVDRHNENLGLLRDKKTGEIISLAPNYDNNMCLLAVHRILDEARSSDGMFKLFKAFITGNEIARSLLLDMDIPLVSKPIIEEILKESPIEVDKESLIKYLINGYEKLNSLIK